MPPFVIRECPQCQHENSYDLTELNRSFMPIFRDFVSKGISNKEYPVTCKKCGNEYIILVDPDEARHGSR